LKTLSQILATSKVKSIQGNADIEILAIVFDSRKVQQGTCFVATRGTTVDGHQFIATAISAGAIAIVCEELPNEILPTITYVLVENSSEMLGLLASSFFDNPSSKMKLVAITGTNGKTSNATLLHHLFRELGYNVGLLSTVQNQINEEVIPATHTTPDAVALNQLLALMLSKGCTHCFMEASSHAIHQYRIAGLELDGAVFTNITHDHLDYHGTFDNYIKAKKKLFDDLSSNAFALANYDDKNGRVMLQNTKATKHSFALKTIADFKGKLLANTLQGLQMEINGTEVWFKLIGAFNAYNLLSVYAVAVLLGEDEREVLTTLSGLNTAKGRFEQFRSTTGITGIVDYAHTPDALENVLETINDLKGDAQVITVVGCGGNRDAAKRPVMAEIAAKLSDKVILTSDNPRNEEPQDILNQMQAGLKSAAHLRKTMQVSDRKEAIKVACTLAKAGDIILLAGKGHEDYQEIKGVKYPFDDKKVLIETLKLLEL
jgi:UDP-N-acetylmuramoyl-L-alanyl-D-glutamate--2,6-diaminopimelate ligase